MNKGIATDKLSQVVGSLKYFALVWRLFTSMKHSIITKSIFCPPN